MDIVDLILSGLSNSEITRLTGKSRNVVHHTRAKLEVLTGVQRRSKSLLPREGSKLRKAYDIALATPDIPLCELANRVGVSAGSLLVLEQKYGFNFPRVRPRKVKVEPVPEVSSNTSCTAPQRLLHLPKFTEGYMEKLSVAQFKQELLKRGFIEDKWGNFRLSVNLKDCKTVRIKFNKLSVRFEKRLQHDDGQSEWVKVVGCYNKDLIKLSDGRLKIGVGFIK